MPSLSIELPCRLGRRIDPGDDLESGAYVDRLEGGWLQSPEVKAADGGTPVEWAAETHEVARHVWSEPPESHVVDDAYYAKVLPSLDQELGLAGMRLARVLNEAYGGACAAR